MTCFDDPFACSLAPTGSACMTYYSDGDPQYAPGFCDGIDSQCQSRVAVVGASCAHNKTAVNAACESDMCDASTSLCRGTSGAACQVVDGNDFNITQPECSDTGRCRPSYDDFFTSRKRFSSNRGTCDDQCVNTVSGFPYNAGACARARVHRVTSPIAL
jgi:hypothetical protein